MIVPIIRPTNNLIPIFRISNHPFCARLTKHNIIFISLFSLQTLEIQ